MWGFPVILLLLACTDNKDWAEHQATAFAEAAAMDLDHVSVQCLQRADWNGSGLISCSLFEIGEPPLALECAPKPYLGCRLATRVFP